MSKRKFKKSLWQKMYLSYYYYHRKGMIRFMVIKSIQVLVFLAVLIAAFNIVDRYFIDLDLVFDEYVGTLNHLLVLGVFLLSESLLGLLPPDFFIVWADQSSYSVMFLTIIAILSYLGGINSYWIGRGLLKVPFIKHYVDKKYDLHTKQIKRWGTIFIALASFLPTPYSPVAMVAGMLKYPFKSYAIYSLTRILRFYIHGVILFNLLR